MNGLLFAILVALGGTALSGIRIVNEGDRALVEQLGKYNGKLLEPGLTYVVPIYERVAYKANVRRERVIDIPPQQCVTRDNVMITADAVVYWRIMDIERAHYQVENLQAAMTNLVLTQIRAEIGKLELDQTFTAREQVNEVLLRELDEATDPWGVKVTRVELRDIVPSKAVQDSMELQMAAERRKRAAILTSEGERDSAVNTARGQAEARVLEAEARQKAAILAAQADRQKQVLQAQATAESLQIVTDALKRDPRAAEALQFLIAQNYLEMGQTIGSSGSSKVMFMDPRAIPATIEGLRAIASDASTEEGQALNPNWGARG